MGDGHETESAVERLLDSWGKYHGARLGPSADRDRFTLGDIYRMSLCIDDLTAALEEDGVIPTRMKRS